MPLRPGANDPTVDRLIQELAQTWDYQPRVEILSVEGLGSPSATVRFRASRATNYVQAHLQSDAAGEGGSIYSPAQFTTSVRLDTFLTKQQDYVVAPASSLNGYYIWLIPVFEDGDGTFVKYDGQDSAEDYKVFWPLGAFPVASRSEELWSLLHLGSGGVALPVGGFEEGDQAMMVGAYAGFDY